MTSDNVVMVSYPGNSHAEVAKNETQQREKKNKVIAGSVKVKQPSLGKKFAKAFFGAEVTDVKGYLRDTLIQATKCMFLDGLSMLFFNTPTGRMGSLMGRGANVQPAFNYSYVSNRGQALTRQPQQVNTDQRPAYDQFIFNTKDEAETVLTSMIECINTYGKVSVNDLYDMVGMTAPWSDVYWGWTNLSTATTSRTYQGYTLILPQPIRINP